MSKILIVDDSPDLVEFLSFLLRTRKHETEIAGTTKELEEKLSLFKPEIILMDVKLAGQDGRQICRNIKASMQFRDVHIILMSAAPQLLKNYREWEACDIIEKPFDIKTVFDKITLHTLISE